ncbi:MAG: gliding motility-associated C-terminal domain-containing protein, partial [Paludibacter sp.]|nr:gliding motility-associated C-terminal domain-containing protein [Paludibacter sp.]
ATICSSDLPYLWHGKSFTAPGTYTDTLINVAGCDSITTLNLTVNVPTSSETNLTVCNKELPLNWNGKTIAAAGIYTDTLTNSVGCDSITTLNLTVNVPTSSETNLTVCNKELPLNWNGKTIAAAGIYTDTLINVAGCDSITTLNLTVNVPTSSETNATICSSDLPYLWHGKSFTATGTYIDTLINVAGCDSITTLNLTVNVPTSSETNATICSSDLPYLWHGKSFTAAGTYTDTLTNSVDCDSITTLNLTVNVPTSSETNAIICSSDLPYLWHGKSFTATGTYTDTLINVAGCDSITTLNLTVNVPVYSFVQRIICPLQIPYFWNGIQCDDAGVYIYKTQSRAGCDSIVQLDLKVADPIVVTTDVTVCGSDLPYVWNSKEFSEPGIYTEALKTDAGCDSIAVLRLNVNNGKSEVRAVTLCNGESYSIDGEFINKPGIYKINYQNFEGCDSTIILNVSYDEGVVISQVIHLLPGESYQINGNTYYNEGTYTDVVKSKNQCDSIVVTQVVLLDIPNTITPNGDGVNDVFMKGYKLKIYNRNGILLYEGDDGWDGTYNGRTVGFDTYFYVLYFDVESGLKTKKGYVTVVR